MPRTYQFVGNSNLTPATNTTASIFAGYPGSVRTGTVRVNYQGQGSATDTTDLWGAGLTDQALMDIMFANDYLSDGKYFLQTWAYAMERLANQTMYFPVSSSVYNHYEMGKYYQGVQAYSSGAWTVGGGSAATGALVVWTGDPANTTKGNVNNTYVKVGDQIMQPKTPGVLYRVTAVSAIAGSAASYRYTLTLTRLDGTNVVTADFANSDLLAIAGNSFGELSSAPTPIGITYGTPVSHKLTTVRKLAKISGSAMTNSTSIPMPGGKSNGILPTVFWQLHNEHMLAVEQILMYGQATPDAGNADGIIAGDGLFTSIWNEAGNLNADYGASLTEGAMKDYADTQRSVTGGNKWNWLCGGELFGDIQNALQGYTEAGATFYGNFSGDGSVFQKAGIDFNQYSYGGVVNKFTHYRGFDDPAQTGTATASATAVDFKNFALVLADRSNVGQIEGLGARESVPAFFMAHKQLGAANRKYVVGTLRGMTGANGGGGDYESSEATLAAMNNPLQTMDDADTFGTLSEIGIGVVGASVNTGTFRMSV